LFVKAPEAENRCGDRPTPWWWSRAGGTAAGGGAPAARGGPHLLVEEKPEPAYFFKALGVSGARSLDLERFPLLTDAEGSFRAAYGVAGSSLYLVRPDGYVAYRTCPVGGRALAAYLERVFRG
jgi:hypothetical protein